MIEQEKIMSDLTDLYNKITKLYQPQLESALIGYSLSEIETIEAISKLHLPNVTRLANHLYITRGAASKITKKLLAKGLAESYQRKGNEKEIYFRLTEKGKILNNKHQALQESFLKQDQPVFDQLNMTDLKSIQKFITLYNRHLDIALKNNQV